MDPVTFCLGKLILKPLPSDLKNKSPRNKSTIKSLFPMSAFSMELLRDKMLLLRMASLNQGLVESLI